MSDACTHLGQIGVDVTPSADGCADCLQTGGRWVNLRICMTCGYVGCCDDSPNTHATAHFQASQHPVVRSFEPGEDWWWCFADKVEFEVEDAPPAPSHS